MGFFSKLFGSKTVATHAVQTSSDKNLLEEVKRQIEMTEGELHDAQMQLNSSNDSEIKASMQLLVTRKTQALKDLEEKYKKLAR